MSTSQSRPDFAALDAIRTSGRKLPTRYVRERYGVTTRTISRWERDPDLNFPKPDVINKRKYYDEDRLTDWDRANACKR
jgi:DNA-binding transcriptional MerR regulator